MKIVDIRKLATKDLNKKLEENNMFTMGDVARMSINNEDVLYKLLGINE